MSGDLTLKILIVVSVLGYFGFHFWILWLWHKEDAKNEQQDAGGKETARAALGNFNTFF